MGVHRCCRVVSRWNGGGISEYLSSIYCSCSWPMAKIPVHCSSRGDYLLHRCTDTLALSQPGSSVPISNNTNFCRNSLPSSISPGPTHNFLYGPVEQCASLHNQCERFLARADLIRPMYMFRSSRNNAMVINSSPISCYQFLSIAHGRSDFLVCGFVLRLHYSSRPSSRSNLCARTCLSLIDSR